MRKPGGYLITASDAGNSEADTFTCGHCQTIVLVKPFADPADMGGRCTCCDKLICPGCTGKGCDPVEEKLKRWEAEYDARRSYGMAG